MAQLEKIDRVVDPDMTLFVDEAVAGQDAVNRAKEFDDAAAIDGAILTKADADSSAARRSPSRTSPEADTVPRHRTGIRRPHAVRARGPGREPPRRRLTPDSDRSVRVHDFRPAGTARIGIQISRRS